MGHSEWSKYHQVVAEAEANKARPAVKTQKSPKHPYKTQSHYARKFGGGQLAHRETSV